MGNCSPVTLIKFWMLPSIEFFGDFWSFHVYFDHFFYKFDFDVIHQTVIYHFFECRRVYNSGFYAAQKFCSLVLASYIAVRFFNKPNFSIGKRNKRSKTAFSKLSFRSEFTIKLKTLNLQCKPLRSGYALFVQSLCAALYG